MTITVPQVVITGAQEQIIRDNVANPDTDLGARALTQLTAPYQSATLQRAQAAFREATTAGETSLPNYLIDADLIAWYLARPGYKDATVRANEQRVIQIDNQIAALASEKSRKQQEADRQEGNEALVTAMNAAIAAIDAQIAALQTEKAALQE